MAVSSSRDCSSFDCNSQNPQEILLYVRCRLAGRLGPPPPREEDSEGEQQEEQERPRKKVCGCRVCRPKWQGSGAGVTLRGYQVKGLRGKGPSRNTDNEGSQALWCGW